MAHHRFNGKDPITVLDFLARFKDSCDRNNISEAAAVWCFQYFLDGQAANVVKTGLSGRSLAVDASRADMLTSYEEVVKTYATEETMAEAIKDVENFKHSSRMGVQAYSDELWTRALRCGSVISSTRLKGYFIQGVLPAIRAGVRYYATEHPDATYEGILSKARSLGDAYTAAKRATSAPRGSVSAAKTTKPKRTAFQIEADASTASSSSILCRAETTVWALMCWLCPTVRAELLPHRQAIPLHPLTARLHQSSRGTTASSTQLPLRLSHQRLTPSRIPLGSCMAPRDAESACLWTI